MVTEARPEHAGRYLQPPPFTLLGATTYCGLPDTALMIRSRVFRTVAALLTAANISACAPARPPAGAVSAPVSTAKGDVGTRGAEVLTWSQAQKEANFPRMDSVFASRIVPHGPQTRLLPVGAPLAPFATGGAMRAMLDEYIVARKVAGLLVLHDGKIRLERYALGHSPTGRWTSFSVAKSLTSTLVGAAIKDGFITSLDDPIVRYIAELRGTAYDGVTVRQLLTMTSGVAFNEDYADPNSDIARLYREPPDSGVDATVSYVRKLAREAEPGTKWRYKTPETNLVGVLVMAATGKTLSQYLSEKIWQPFGMEGDATWSVDHIGHEQGGCCLQARLRDFARVGQFVLEGGRAGGVSVVAEGWFEAATSKQADTGSPGGGYGYQWWTSDDGTFQARGIFGQLIHLDPARRLVVVMSSAWPAATGREESRARSALLAEITKAIDGERAMR